MKNSYGLGKFLGDAVLGALTGGLWWIYRIIKVLSK